MQNSVVFRYRNEATQTYRRPRTFWRDDGCIESTLPSIAAGDAPLAITSKRSTGVRHDYRYFAGKLWLPLKRQLLQGWKEVDMGYFRDHLHYFVKPDVAAMKNLTRDQELTEIERLLERYITIDDIVHYECGEPRYVIVTHGSGKNVGGTELMDHEYRSPHIPEDRYFNLLQRDLAIEYATAIAISRGDTKSLPMEPHTEFTILLPQAIKQPMRLKPKKQN